MTRIRFHQSLGDLKDRLLVMAGMAEQATQRAIEAYRERDISICDLVLRGDGAATSVEGGHVPQPTPLADVLEVIGPTSFRLLGRSNDLVNIAGKRSSIGHLDFHLNAIEGVHDGAFWMPPEDADAAVVTRLIAFVVAPSLSGSQIRQALRPRVDAAFMPRRIVHLDALPREGTGKLTAARLAELALRSGVA